MRENQGLWELTLQGQGSGTDDFDDNALNGSVSVGYFLFNPFELGVRQIVSLVSIDDRPGKDTRADGSTRLFADLHVPFQYLSPFVGGSFGWVYGDNVKETLAAGLEGGLKWYVKEDAFLLGMLGWDWFFDDGDQIDERFDNGQWVYSIGIGLTF